MTEEEPRDGAGERAGERDDDGARARLARFGALPQGPDPSTWTTDQPVGHGADPSPDRFEELRRNLLLGGA
ncbi:hypothetical protein FHN55_02380 [Streptomyces sp. NP160]|uniref:hypothetical protein n=1 Tax=Streptomyces sp. NP160 TaxID=2586637 RepID=UPI0011195FC0|nr:hypothetical protein [Streptomyces sp. NP160]TNM69626.1 hypothetical protein FHN55_02380 [Streptomyces sp. NP160]